MKKVANTENAKVHGSVMMDEVDMGKETNNGTAIEEELAKKKDEYACAAKDEVVGLFAVNGVTVRNGRSESMARLANLPLTIQKL